MREPSGPVTTVVGRSRPPPDGSEDHTARAGKTQLSLRGDCPNIDSSSPKIMSPVIIAPIHMATPTFSTALHST